MVGFYIFYGILFKIYVSVDKDIFFYYIFWYFVDIYVSWSRLLCNDVVKMYFYNINVIFIK